jgi:hypothetical protein
MMTLAAWRAFHPIVLPYWTRSVAWCHPVGSHRHCSYDQGWSTAYGGWHCIVATCPHVMLALMVTATLVRNVHPLPATATLSYACALGTCEPSRMTGPAATSFALEPRGPQRVVGYMAPPEPSLVGRWGSEPWDTWQH